MAASGLASHAVVFRGVLKTTAWEATSGSHVLELG